MLTFLFFKNEEFFIPTSYAIAEAPSIVILFICLLRCGQYLLQSQVKHVRAFWLAAVLVFFVVMRRELNHLPDLFITSDFMLLSHSYDWWEDAILTVVYLLMVGLLVYSRHYLWAVLKKVPVSLYLTVAALALLQYMGENAIVFSKDFGVIVEELAETVVYGIALLYLWRFELSDDDCYLLYELNYECSHSNH